MAGPEPILIGGRYVLLHQLGAGGMASVWLAADRRLNDKHVAVKRLHGFRADTPDAAADIERARREAYAASRISHPNLVSVTDFIADGGEPFIVMEYVDGVTLDDIVARGGLPFDEAARLVGQVAGALAEAHAAGIVHRDIKPSNIIVTPRGDAKLADFGIARSRDDPRFTRTGSFTGTMRYLAPEVLDGADPDPAADVWALGATLFEAAEGRPAFQAPTNIALMAAIAVGPLPAMTRAPVLAGILARLLDRDASRRPTAHETANALRTLAAPTRERALHAPFLATPSAPPPSGPPVGPHDSTRLVAPTPYPPPVRPGARAKRRTRAWVVVAVPSVVALAAGVTIAIAANRGNDHPLANGNSPRTTSTGGVGIPPGGSRTSSSNFPTSTSPTAADSTGAAPTGPPSTGAVAFAGVTVRNPTNLTRSPGLTSNSSGDATALQVRDLVRGTGAPATPAATVSVEYSGVLYRNGVLPFDTTWTGAAAPRSFALTQTIDGFRQGIGGTAAIPAMRVGGRRVVIIPAALAYGAQGSPNGIPPNASIVFCVDLRAVS